MDSWERIAEPRLPPKEAFYSKLTYEGISKADYFHAQKVWETFGCISLGTTATSTARPMFCCWQMSWRTLEDLPEAIWFGSDALLHQPQPILGCPPEENRRWAQVTDRLWPAPLYREGHAWRHLNGVKAPRQGKQPKSWGLWPGEAKQSHPLSGRQ